MATPGSLTDGRLIAKNTVRNLVGQVAPLVVGVVTVPVLVQGLGTERFGILTLIWMFVGYFGLFDLGLGRALTKLVAEHLGEDREDHVVCTVWVATVILGALGALGGAVSAGLSGWLTRSVLMIPSSLVQETISALLILAATIPIVITSTALRGVLEAYQRFDLVVLVRAPSGAWTFLGPTLATLLTPDLAVTTGFLAVGRYVAWLAYLLLCIRIVPSLRRPDLSRWRSILPPLLSFGGWMTVTNVVGPIMVRLDRFVIGATMTMTAVAYYATPYEFVTRLWVIPSAVVGVLFPAFSSALASDRTRAADLFERGNRYLFIGIFPIVLGIVALAPEGLNWWLGVEFASASTPVLRWLAYGVWVNCLAHVPFALIQANGRPDITAKLHLIEAPIYLVLLWVLLSSYGVEGAAMAWAARVTADTLGLHLLSRTMITLEKPLWYSIGAVAVGTGLLGIVAFLDNTMSRALVLGVILVILSLVAWLRLLTADERRYLLSRIGTTLRS